MNSKFAFIILSVFFAFNISSAVKYKSTKENVDMTRALDALSAAFSSGNFERNHISITDFEFTERELNNLSTLSGVVADEDILFMLLEALKEDSRERINETYNRINSDKIYCFSYSTFFTLLVFFLAILVISLGCVIYLSKKGNNPLVYDPRFMNELRKSSASAV